MFLWNYKVKNFYKNLILITVFLAFFSLNIFSQSNKYINYKDVKEIYESEFKDLNPNRKKGNKWFYRWLWDNRFDIQPDGYEKYFEQFQVNTEKSDLSKMQSIGKWIPLGPKEMAPTYEFRSGHGMGRVNCVAFHPTDPDILWIGTPGGGVWKTFNSGKNWEPMSDFLPTLAISNIAVDPKNPDIVYICTGDFDTGGMNSSLSYGVYKSTDGGNSWAITPLLQEQNFNRSMLRKLIIHPDSTNKLITVGTFGIWKSDDAGETWRFIIDSLMTDIEIDPTNPEILYGAMGTKWSFYGSAGVLKSTDFGETWTELNTGIPPKNQISRMELAIAPSDPNYIYVLNATSSRGSFHSIYYSTDAGNSWQIQSDNKTQPNILGAYDGGTGDNYGQGTYDLTLLVDPIDKKKIYTGGINIWVSEDEGKTFDIASLWIYVFGKSIHADHHYSAFNPLNNYFYFTNDGGIYRTKNIQAGSRKWIIDYIDKVTENIKPDAPDTLRFPTVWENLSSGLNISEFYRLNVSRAYPNYITGGTQDNSCFYYNSNEWINYIANWDGMETMIDHKNPEIIYGVWQNGGLCRSDDGGKNIISGLADTIRGRGENGLWITPIAMNPIHPAIIYAGFRNVWKSMNYGKDWEKILDFDSKLFDTVNKSSISITKTSYNSSNHLAIYKDRPSTKIAGELWLTADMGKTWKKSKDILPVDSMSFSSIEYHNTDPSKLWVSFYTSNSKLNLFYSENFGDTWINVSRIIPAGIGILSIVRDPFAPTNIIYAGTNKGVYYTDDSMDKWMPFMENLPNVKVNELEISHVTNELYAATYGRGIWKTSTISSSVINKTEELSKIEIFPNPTINSINIKLNSKIVENQPATISIVDIAGNVVYQNKFNINNSDMIIKFDFNLPNGIYFAEVKGNGIHFIEKFVIRK